jgi:hypothetical protein
MTEVHDVTNGNYRCLLFQIAKGQGLSLAVVPLNVNGALCSWDGFRRVLDAGHGLTKAFVSLTKAGNSIAEMISAEVDLGVKVFAQAVVTEAIPPGLRHLFAEMEREKKYVEMMMAGVTSKSITFSS